SVPLPALRGGGIAEPYLDHLAANRVPIVDLAEGARMLVAAVSSPPPSPPPPSPPPPPAPSPASLEAYARELVAAATERSPADIDPHATFPSLGLDSLAAIDIVKRLEQRTGRSLPDTLLYEHDTLARLVAALAAAPAAAPAP